MKKIYRKTMLGLFAITVIGAGAALVSRSVTAGPPPSANGEGTLFRQNDSGDQVRRQFSFSGQLLDPATGAAKGNAVLHNPAFTVANGQKYQLQIDIRCMKVVGNFATFGGLTRRTNDPTLVDAVFFSVVDNGNPGKGKDQLSAVYFWDGDPNTVGKEMNCVFNDVNSLALETIESGNIQVK